MLSKPFARVNHLDATMISHFRHKFTYAYPSHYSQNKLNQALLSSLQRDESSLTQVKFGMSYESHQMDESGVTVTAANGERVRCQALVGADGVNSRVRVNMGNPKMYGVKSK